MINPDGSDATGLASVESNLTLWLDASNSNYVKLDSSNKVEEWVDLSLKALSMANTAARPSYDAANKAISFNGTSLRRHEKTW